MQKVGVKEVAAKFKAMAMTTAPKGALRVGIRAGLRLIRDAIILAAPVNRRRVRKATKAFARRAKRATLEALQRMRGPNVSGSLRRSAGYKFRGSKGPNLQARVGLNIGKSPTRTPNAYARHAHLNVLGTKDRTHKKTGKRVGRMTRNPFVKRAVAASGTAAIAACKREAVAWFKKELAKRGIKA